MKIIIADGIHYCYDCGELIIKDCESIWCCPKHAKSRGWNIIDGRRIKINKDENENNRTATETNPNVETNKSGSTEGNQNA